MKVPQSPQSAQALKKNILEWWQKNKIPQSVSVRQAKAFSDNLLHMAQQTLQSPLLLSRKKL